MTYAKSRIKFNTLNTFNNVALYECYEEMKRYVISITKGC